MKLVLSQVDHFYDLLTFHIRYLNVTTNPASDVVRDPGWSLTENAPLLLSQADVPERTRHSGLGIALAWRQSCMISLAFPYQRGTLREGMVSELFKGTAP